MVLVGYDQEWHHSFRGIGDCEELQYLTMLVPLRPGYNLYFVRNFHADQTIETVTDVNGHC